LIRPVPDDADSGSGLGLLRAFIKGDMLCSGVGDLLSDSFTSSLSDRGDSAVEVSLVSTKGVTTGMV
jgi:hypothetical protein